MDPVETPKKQEEGAPQWVVTFGDLMSLLLCFFVLLLSFSEMDRQKYKEVAGSLAKAFGVQRKVQVMQSPKGIKMIAKDFDQHPVPLKVEKEFISTQLKESIGEELRQEIEISFGDMKDMIQVDIEGDRIAIRLMGETAFDSGKAELRPQMRPLLKKIGTTLKGIKGDIVISGHTDNVPIVRGPYKSNLHLSTARAASVAEYIQEYAFVDPTRVATMGFAEHRPIATNETPEGRQMNRRVEIILTAIPNRKNQASN